MNRVLSGEMMFFLLSKLLWIFTAPSNVVGMLFGIATIGLFTRHARKARYLAAFTLCLYAILGFLPVGPALFQILENRFERNQDLTDIDGIVVLGGAMIDPVSADRNIAQLSEAGTRMTQAAMLARKYPTARVVFSGGSARIFRRNGTETDSGRLFFQDEGIATERLTFEDRSRNTWENAVFTKELAQPKPGERWILVTSASHMPRAMGIFRKVGFDVIAWPGDYTTTRGSESIGLILEAGEGLHSVDRAVREWIGLIAYYATGKTSALFPAP